MFKVQPPGCCLYQLPCPQETTRLLGTGAAPVRLPPGVAAGAGSYGERRPRLALRHLSPPGQGEHLLWCFSHLVPGVTRVPHWAELAGVSKDTWRPWAPDARSLVTEITQS